MPHILIIDKVVNYTASPDNRLNTEPFGREKDKSLGQELHKIKSDFKTQPSADNNTDVNKTPFNKNQIPI